MEMTDVGLIDDNVNNVGRIMSTLCVMTVRSDVTTDNT